MKGHDANEAKKCVQIDIKSLLKRQRFYGFFAHFLNPAKNQTYMNIIGQDLKKVRVGHSTESAKNFETVVDPDAYKELRNLKLLRLGKNQQLEQVNRDKNI